MEKERRAYEEMERKKKFSKIEKVIQIQSFFRMKLAKKYKQKLKKRFQILQSENRATNELKEFEQHCLENYFMERDKVFIS